ncbi:MAG: fatty acyl-AMP ligase [bacterium]|nr:fatty acyl-AMP ligase [bacterium]
MSTTENVIERFRRHVRSRPEKDLYVFVDDKGRDQERLTYGRFAAAVDRLAAHLIDDLGLRPGDRVMLVYPPSADFVTAFVGCLAAGLVPVPVAPPNPFKLDTDQKTFEAVASDGGCVAVLTNRGYLRAKRLAAARDLFARRPGAWSELPWHRTDGAGSRERPSAETNLPDLDEPAFLQYTSGSTSTPKGVMISHRNILHQLTINAEDLRLSAGSRAVLWVPHFHDFCLVSGILSALYGNAVLYLMSPLTFLRRPHLWFEVMTRVRATHTAAPDFAYRLAVRKTTPEQRRGWDLSALTVAMSAAEPIRASTVDGFLGGFAAAGFSPEAFCPAYGLAEHTVGVSVAGSHRLRVDRELLERQRRVRLVEEGDDSETLVLFSCGPPSSQVDVRIVDPDSLRELEPGQVGEIWVDSPSKALGYHGRAELSDQVFRAHLDGDAGGASDGYLRTGDLGFVHDGEVFVTGRLKDLIIVRGRNLYPQDLEESVFSSHPLVRPGRAVAFSAPAGSSATDAGERIVVMTEVHSKKVSNHELDEVVHAARTSVQREHGISCDVLLIARPGEILKTTSGKVRRQACRQAWLDGELDGRLLRLDVKRSRAGEQRVSSSPPGV